MVATPHAADAAPSTEHDIAGLYAHFIGGRRIHPDGSPDLIRNNPSAADQLRAPIYEDKVVDFILEMAQVTERNVPPAELLAEAEEDGESGGEQPA